MKSQINLDTPKNKQMKKILAESLQGNKKVDYNLKIRKKELEISVETETQPQLRGCTDTVFRLSSLSQKIFRKY